MGMQSFCQWAWRMGWRYVVAGASLLMVVLERVFIQEFQNVLTHWFSRLGGVVKTVRGW